MAEIKNGGDGLEERNIVIIGGGTAGFAAGVYTSRAMLEPLLITGDALGGQLSLTLDLENYPGFFGTEAAEFITGMQKQAERFGTEVRFDMVTEVDFNRHPFYLKTYDQGVPRQIGYHLHRCLAADTRHPRRGRVRWTWCLLLRHLRWILFSEPTPHRRRWRRRGP